VLPPARQEAHVVRAGHVYESHGGYDCTVAPSAARSSARPEARTYRSRPDTRAAHIHTCMHRHRALPSARTLTSPRASTVFAPRVLQSTRLPALNNRPPGCAGSPFAANLIHRPPRPSALRPSRSVRGSCSLRCPPRPHPRRARPASCPSLQPLATMTPARAPAAALPAHFAVAALLLSPAAAAVLKCQSARFPLVDCCGAVRCRPVRV
jgi:hypothetical protein